MRPVSLVDVVLLVLLGSVVAQAWSRHDLFEYCKASGRSSADCKATIYVGAWWR